MEINDSYEFDYVVQDSDLAKTISVSVSDDFPPVLATSRMVALMEVAAARLLQPLLQDGELSVGVGVDIKHIAPTLTGVKITVQARFYEKSNKQFLFEVEVRDSAGSLGTGKHSRAIIQTKRLLKSASDRA